MTNMKVPSFDTLVELFQRDPEMFEKVRKRLIKEHIDQLPEDKKKRAEQMQFTIESKLSLKKTPLSRFYEMQRLLYEGFGKFQEVISDPYTAVAAKKIKDTQTENNILIFKSEEKDE